MKNFFKSKIGIITLSATAVILALLIIGGFMLFRKKPEKVPKEKPAVTSSVQSEQTSSEEKIPLILTSPSSENLSTTATVIPFSGTCDKNSPLTINGTEYPVNEDGTFYVELPLNYGSNSFTVTNGENTKTYTINCIYVIIKEYYPSKNSTYESGSTVGAAVLARIGSTVTAEFNGKTVNLIAQQPKEGEQFCNYTAPFTLPSGNADAVALGKIKFTASIDGKTDVKYSGKITVNEDPSVTYVAEVVAYAAETFNGNTTDDNSSPLNNYLPQGTVDYCYKGTVYDPASDNTYYKLRCGKRVYVQKRNAPEKTKRQVTKRYVGTLPDHNEITPVSVDINGHHTVMTFNTMWKAPFFFTLAPQGYSNPAKQDYTIGSFTCTYVDIKFCYTTVFPSAPEIPEDNPLFSGCEIIPTDGGYTLRLYLRNAGEFYGWDCNYDANGRMVFTFLNPVKTHERNNLSGINILIDVGHGGSDSGANGANRTYESERNLNLANKLKAELEAMGANVFMTRTSDTTLSADDKCALVKKYAADLCIAIHHDSSTNATANGFSIFYSTPFSAKATREIYNTTKNANIYGKIWDIRWHYYFTARMTVCPVVLTENGFMSNNADLSGICNDAVNTQKAKAIAQGIANYFYEQPTETVQ